VSELVHRELSLLLIHAARDPRLAHVTITGVDVTPDLLLARVHFSVLGDADEEREALAGLEHANGFLRSELAARVRLRFVPQLVFQVDRSAAQGRRIDELLAQIQEVDRPGDEHSAE
jgi:ribosome-binding factor A